jgi:folate-binding protein YgfZ
MILDEDKYWVLYSKELEHIEGSLFTLRDPRYSKLGTRSLVPQEIINCSESLPDLYRCDKYAFTIPDGYSDMIRGKSIISEYSPEYLNAVSYSKGCYMGQEFITRAKNYGVIRKKLCKINSNTKLRDIFPDRKIIYQNREVGILCSSWGNIGIALIRSEEDNPIISKDLVFQDHSGKNVSVELHSAKWYPF